VRQFVVRIVVFPRYTTLVGTTSVFTMPIDVREFGQANFVAWMGTGIGATPAEVEFKVQESADLSIWNDIETITPSAGAETVADVTFDLPWLRVKATVSGADPGVSFWMTGELVRREGAAGEAAA
jgi:hypothetical protein